MKYGLDVALGRFFKSASKTRASDNLTLWHLETPTDILLCIIHFLQIEQCGNNSIEPLFGIN